MVVIEAFPTTSHADLLGKGHGDVKGFASPPPVPIRLFLLRLNEEDCTLVPIDETVDGVDDVEQED